MSIKTYRVLKYFMIMMVVCAILMGTGMLSGCKTDKQSLIINSSTRNNAAPSGKIPFPSPESHKAGWLEYHGGLYEVNWNSPGQQGNSCLTCHEKEDCIQCHAVRPPRDHKSTWRTFGHGFAAAGDRERCLTCHRQDYCIRCHNETAPRSHKGNWKDNHCGRCHYDLDSAFGTGCAACHQQPLHLSAPHTVNPQVNCLDCHS